MMNPDSDKIILNAPMTRRRLLGYAAGVAATTFASSPPLCPHERIGASSSHRAH